MVAPPRYAFGSSTARRCSHDAQFLLRSSGSTTGWRRCRVAGRALVVIRYVAVGPSRSGTAKTLEGRRPRLYRLNA